MFLPYQLNLNELLDMRLNMFNMLEYGAARRRSSIDLLHNVMTERLLSISSSERYLSYNVTVIVSFRFRLFHEF